GKYEGQGAEIPEALRRGMQGDTDADVDVAALLDDANVDVRRKAARVLYDLKSKRVIAQLRRAEQKDEDSEVSRFTTLALVRGGDAPDARAEALLLDRELRWRRFAALAFAERGDARGDTQLAAWWSSDAPPKGTMDFLLARDLLGAIAARKVRAAVPALTESLADIRLRPLLADALGAIGDPEARPPLLRVLSEEPYATARMSEARALVLLGAKEELFAPLERHAALSDPMIEAIGILAEAHL